MQIMIENCRLKGFCCEFGTHIQALLILTSTKSASVDKDFVSSFRSISLSCNRVSKKGFKKY